MVAVPYPKSNIPQRLSLHVEGIVQGVGFRPFVYTLARSVGVTGWVQNTAQGVFIEIEGTAAQLQSFQQRLEAEKPEHALLQRVEVTQLESMGDQDFRILPSSQTAAKTALILPDLATCPTCLAEMWEPTNRRYRYPFINCTHCGPRFSIVRSLPYDRPHTTMAGFPLCPDCRREYEDPCDRRFHAQPNACSTCGPHVELWDREGNCLEQSDPALRQAAVALEQGQVLALKGLGGFHLMVDATNEAAVQTLRQRKHRPDKPLAVIFPSLAMLRDYCEVSDAAVQVMQSAAAPIVLLPLRTDGVMLAPGVAPGNPSIGAMLPYTPLHHLLLAEVNRPIVATSGNLSGEPICIDERDALERLGQIADSFLVHNRPIARPVDDSIVQMVQDQPVTLRRARGYAPFPVMPPVLSSPALLPQGEGSNSPEVPLPRGEGFRVRATNAERQQDVVMLDVPLPDDTKTLGSSSALRSPLAPLKKGGIGSKFPLFKGDLGGSVWGVEKQLQDAVILSVGSHLKNTVALHLHGQTLISQHLGDLDTPQGCDRFKETIQHLCGLYDLQPTDVDAIAHDAHPDYYSTQFAKALLSQTDKSPQLIPVQHHYAHVLSCMVDNQWQPPVLGVAWDGTGYGLDGTIWGGELLWIPSAHVPAPGFERVGHVKPFPLPGSERATVEPRRSAIGLLYSCLGDRAFDYTHLPCFQTFTAQEQTVLHQMLQRGLNAPLTSSMGRLFDAVASLVGLRQQASFEGQAAMALEFAIAHPTDQLTDQIYPYALHHLPDSSLQFDPKPMVLAILDDLANQELTADIAITFHNTLIAALVEIIQHLCKRYPELQKVALTGGCFQNRYLLNRAIQQLQAINLSVGWHQTIPTNDGGISAGQTMAALIELNNQLVVK
ncbi:MAG: carbamoyltransferase HypF [Thainema sp.]